MASIGLLGFQAPPINHHGRMFDNEESNKDELSDKDERRYPETTHLMNRTSKKVAM
jgi:hypothetical protein